MKNDLYKEAYGRWAGNPRGIRPDYTRCCESVFEKMGFAKEMQCSRKRGHGPDSAYCKQHDPVAVAERKRIADEKYKKERQRRRVEYWGPTFLETLRKIEAGHNDARGLAKEIIERFENGI